MVGPWDSNNPGGSFLTCLAQELSVSIELYKNKKMKEEKYVDFDGTYL